MPPRAYDDHDEYDDYDEAYDDEYGDYDYPRPLSQRAVEWGLNSGIVAIIALTLIYALFPIDAIPDFIPVAGQADDLAAVFAGGGSVTFLAVMRLVLRTRIGRWGCVIFLGLSAAGACAIFWLVARLVSSLT